jgi:hypothetical protein
MDPERTSTLFVREGSIGPPSPQSRSHPRTQGRRASGIAQAIEPVR